MEMEKAYYVVTFKPEYFELIGATDNSSTSNDADPESRRMIVSITQGGFGQDIVDDERQLKERLMEYLFVSDDLDLPRTAEVFDRYFEIEHADEFVDLDQEQ
jgi:hypothetical protein